MTTSAHSDAELLARARQGDETAFAELYVRHEAAALRLARGYPRAGDPDDLVAESFARVLRALRQGAGPTEAFRAYLFVTLRRIAAARIARRQDDPYDEVPEPVRAEASGAGEAEAEADDRRMVVAAYESLPSRWQSVLWHTAVEGHPPRDVGPTLGMSANAAAALAYRAREKLRQAYLQAHLRVTSRPECEPHRSRLGAYVRQGLGARARAATDDHIGECASCRSLVGELSDIDQLLVRSMVPFFVTTASISGAAVSAGAAAGAASRPGARSRPRRPGLAERPAATAATAAVVAAAAALVTVMVTVLADRTSPPAPLDLPPVPTSQAAPSDEVARPARPDRGGTGADEPDEPVVLDEPASAPAPPSDSSTVTGSPSFVSRSSPQVDRSRGSAGSAVPVALSRPVVTTPPPMAVPGPPPTTSPVPLSPPVTQSPATTSPPTTSPATLPPIPVTTTVPVPVTTTVPAPPVPPADPGGDRFGCGCDILGPILRGLL